MTPETCTTSNAQRTDRDETANVAALLPCPFCGGNHVTEGASHDYISVWCDCGARGPGVPFPDDCDPVPPILECYAAWNRRAAPTLPADVKGVVRRLNEGIQTEPGCSHPIWSDVEKADALMAEAAAALTAQAALLDRAREVIRPFAEEAEHWAGFDDIENLVESWPGGPASGVKVCHLRAASRLHHEMGGDRG